MNRPESRYSHTAELMDDALISLLDEKEYAYITVKELCARAGVNRTTFYLHYEGMQDLLAEASEHIVRKLRSYFSETPREIISQIANAEVRPEERKRLIFLTPQYLHPYLKYIRDNRKVLSVALAHTELIGAGKAYENLYVNIFRPIMERFGASEAEAAYKMVFYTRGLTAIVEKWVQNDCRDEIGFIADLMISCVFPDVDVTDR